MTREEKLKANGGGLLVFKQVLVTIDPDAKETVEEPAKPTADTILPSMIEWAKKRGII